MNTEYISIREKQAIGALSILAFLKNYNIKYEGLEELISHLLNILKSDDLPEWNNKGMNIEVVGRGEDLPLELEKIVPEKLYKDFYDLLDNAIEIGIIDMFGNITEEPDECLLICLEILKRHDINLIVPEILLDFNYTNKSWGEPWSSDKYEKLQDAISHN